MLHQKVSGRISAPVLQKNLEALNGIGRLSLWNDEYIDARGVKRSKPMITLFKNDGVDELTSG